MSSIYPDPSRPEDPKTSGLACLRCWMEGVQVSNLTSEVRNLMTIAQLVTGKPRTAWHGTSTPSKSPRHIVEDKDISAYRFTTSAQCHGTKTGSVPDCSALRYWESGTEGERVSVISGDRNRVERNSGRPNPQKRTSAMAQNLAGCLL